MQFKNLEHDYTSARVKRKYNNSCINVVWLLRLRISSILWVWETSCFKPTNQVCVPLMLSYEHFYTIISSAQTVFMALICVSNHLGEHADTTDYARYLSHSVQHHKVPRISVHCASKGD